ncbi:MAG: HU family DNA-binding protein [Clostridiales bacterium]|nr:HU family DNA-binding protein [Clostridiales bacterium]
MKKSDFIALVAEKGNLTKKDAEVAIEAYNTAVIAALKSGEKVQLVGFGTYEPRHRAERDGFNPITKEKIRIKASINPSFKAGKAFKAALN